MLGSKNIYSIAQVYEENHMSVLRSSNKNIRAAFENKTAFALLHFEVEIVFPVLLIQKVLFPPPSQSAKCGGILSISSEAPSIAGIVLLSAAYF